LILEAANEEKVRAGLSPSCTPRVSIGCGSDAQALHPLHAVDRLPQIEWGLASGVEAVSHGLHAAISPAAGFW